jgi:predicted enzyme related to lactoylglutathione lyase
MRNSKDNPVKVVLFVPDAQAVADKVMAAGGSIAQPAARSPAYDNRLLIVTKDPDGYVFELVQ